MKQRSDRVWRLVAGWGLVCALAAGPARCLADADLQVLVMDSVDPAVLGSTVDYTVRVVNAGTELATGVVVTNQLPGLVTRIDSEPDQGSFTDLGENLLRWSVGTLDAGASATWHLTVHADAVGAATNRVSVSSDLADSNPGNNEATEITDIRIGMTDLQILVLDSADPAVLGADYNYTVQVVNSGAELATGVVVTNQLPGLVSRVDSEPSQGSFTDLGENLLRWNLGTLGAGASATWHLTVRADMVGVATNRVTVGGAVVDPSPGNDQAQETTGIRIGATDLQILVVGPSDPMLLGGTYDYTVRVVNAGSELATGVVATNQLATEVSRIESEPSQGSFTDLGGNLLRWNVGTLGAGATATWRLTVRADAIGTATNRAVLGGTVVDPNPGNNEAEVSGALIGSRLRSLAFSKGLASLTFLTAKGESYTLQYSPNLQADSWTNRLENIVGLPIQTTVPDTNPAATGFYRIVLPNY